ncbi:uncharacterized protein LOC110983210 isoform X2 [Acanthaster planci]|uniref:PHD finger protein 10 n=1 Tax=Acanthaster planci TaxID=133434 RepID=A0A8B7YXB8_ACAPL|nr:uncharacterized protein LOC110983210 isoform X2 [Acanthaster planci]
MHCVRNADELMNLTRTLCIVHVVSMAESSHEMETQQACELPPRELPLTPAVELGDEIETNAVSTSSPARVPSPVCTDVDQLKDAAEDGAGSEGTKEHVVEHAPDVLEPFQVTSVDVAEQASACMSEPHNLQEESSLNISEMVDSPDQIQEDLPEESCDSYDQVENESFFQCPSEENVHTLSETTFTTCLDKVPTGMESMTDTGVLVRDTDSIKPIGREDLEMLEPEETPSPPEIVPIEVGQSPEKPAEIEDCTYTNVTEQDFTSSQAVTEPEVEPTEVEDRPSRNDVTLEQTTTTEEFPVDEPKQISENQIAAEEDVEVSVPANQISSVQTTVMPESVAAALVCEDTNSSQDVIKDDTLRVKPLATLDAATDASGRSTPNVDFLKDLTGRDSPSIRSLKEDSGRDSPSQRSRRRIGRDSVVTEANEANMGIFPAENLFEYQWPQDKGAEWYFVQEQVSEFLQVKSFKRKYPDLERRVMDIHEKEFLRERGVVTEEQVTLGLTALRADEVYDLMLKDAPEKSAEYARVLHEKEKQNISNKHKQYEAPSVDSNKVQEYVKKAVRQAADYNSALMAERREERLYYFDMQTLTVQMPASRMKRQDKEATKMGPYPVSVIPGQYQNYYRSYSAEELKYFPLNTALYGPMAPRRQTDLAPPPNKDEPDQLSDNETVLSTENFDSSSDVSDRDQPMPMDLDATDSADIGSDDRNGHIMLPVEPSSSVYKPKDIPDAICGLCLKNSSQNKMGVPEKMIHCSQCDNSGHPTCLDMTQSMVEVIQTYPWQCMECKTCFHCGDPTHEDKMMFCDMCDRGYHTFCVGLQDIPTGLWACESCQMRDVPAALAPHVPTPPLPPTPPLADPSLVEEPSSPQLAESTPSSKKKGRRSATPVSVGKQSTPGMKRMKSSTPTPKRVKKK